ncbi:MAG: transporter substrate-binding domain-containing protein [Oligoflexia bacterium]|nr:transporter substrate-binding domain-containing protein [Oligoflexia bacterium]
MKNLIAILFCSLISFSAFADTITLRADEWCPYNCKPGSADPGFIIEAAQIIFKKAGHEVDYQNLPWARALDSARLGTIVGAVGAGVEDLVNGIIGTKVPQISSRNGFFVKKGDAWTYKNPDSLQQLKTLGVIIDYTYTEEVDNFISQNKQKIDAVGGLNPLETNMKKLAAGRISAIIEDVNVFNYAANKAQLSSSFSPAGTLSKQLTIYIAFSEKHSKGKEYLAIFEKGWEELKKSGELKKIATKYGIKDV